VLFFAKHKAKQGFTMGKPKSGGNNARSKRHNSKPVMLSEEEKPANPEEGIDVLENLVNECKKEGHFTKHQCEILSSHTRGSGKTTQLKKYASESGTPQEFAKKVKNLRIFKDM